MNAPAPAPTHLTTAPAITLRIFLILFVALTACRNPSTKTGTGPRALPPQEALQSFRLSEDFHLELFLSEPEIHSPVEMIFDENGRIYVAEMLDYPDDPPAGKPARSRIRLLEDADGDGRYEKNTVFADQVLQVSGFLPWKEGLIVTSAPDILWMKDNNGDGVADVKKVLYTGFPKVNPENRITNPRYGIDNWIYTANNGNAGEITASDQPPQIKVQIRGTDFRFHPVTGDFETASGPTQYGLTFDDWGNQFITQNTIHTRHVVLPMHYIARAPTLEVPAYAQDISDHGRPSAQIFPLTGPQEWRKQRTALRQQRYNEQGLSRVEQLSGFFSGASGGMIYSGDVWPEEYRGSLFTGDVSANMVHRDVLSADGVTLKASRAKNETEFIASTDVWSRPCNFTNAPDGNLYMMDVYRLFIETPESIPEEIKKGMDFYAGDTMGRIYRIVSNSPRKQRDLRPNLGKASVEELVKNLESTNGWHRQTAQRLIVERQDRAAIPYLKELAAKSSFPQGRIHALWTLQGLNEIEETLVLNALKDPNEHVREHGLRLAEEFLLTVCDKLDRRNLTAAQSQSQKNSHADSKNYVSLLRKEMRNHCAEKIANISPQLKNAILAITKDADLRVKFQLAFTLGQMRDRRSLEALADLAAQHSADQWFRLAILSSVNQRAAEFFHLLRARHAAFENSDLFAQTASLIGTKHDANELSKLLSALPSLKAPEAVLNSLAKSLQLAGVKNLTVLGAENSLTKLINNPAEAVQKAAWETARFLELKNLVQRAMTDAVKTDLPAKERITAIRALRGGQFDAVYPILQKLLLASEPAEIKTAAIESLSSFDDPTVAAMLLGAWKTYTPEIRAKALEALLSERERMKTLMRSLESGEIEKAAVGEEMRARLYDHPDRETAERARSFFKNESSDRAQVVNRYQNALQMNGEVTRGKQVFETHCARCHIPQKQYGRIGPDLSGINNKTKEELLTSILNPGYAIEPRFVNYIVTVKTGRIHSGILANETPGAITLRGLEGDITILRQNVASIKSSEMSLMPATFDLLINQQQMADLIAYLRGGL